jgi:L-amino acid N-acyltransferase YncA
MRIAVLEASDWPRVAAIYGEGMAGGLATFETECPSWEEWDAAHLVCCRLVARVGDEIVGWAALSPVSRRQCYAGVAEVSIYVGADARRQGVGRALLEALIRDSEEHGIWTLQGATFAENLASLRLQASCGFRVVGRSERIAQLNGVWRDTILTERRSGSVGKGQGAAMQTFEVSQTSKVQGNARRRNDGQAIGSAGTAGKRAHRVRHAGARRMGARAI